MSEQEISKEDRLGPLSDALSAAVEILRKLDPLQRGRLLRTLSVLFESNDARSYPVGPITSSYSEQSDRFSHDQQLSPKEFLLKKQPQSEVERVACLGYYLSNYRSQPHFKTLDISKLNTEAAQTKLSNPTRAVDNATKNGYLVQATKGAKQLSAAGEIYVETLPDKAAALQAMAQSRPRRVAKKKKVVG